MNTKYELISSYRFNSVYELDFDIRDKYEWYILWDTLYVKDTKDSEWREFDPSVSCREDVYGNKHPFEVDLFIHDENGTNHQIISRESN